MAAHDTVIQAKSRATVPTDLAVLAPEGYYPRLAPRSGLSKRGIDLGGGVVDLDYRGNVGIILIILETKTSEPGGVTELLNS